MLLNHFPPVSGRSSAYGDATAEGHPAGPGSVSSSTGAISTTTGHQEGDGSEGEGEGEGEGDVHTSNRSGPGHSQPRGFPMGKCFRSRMMDPLQEVEWVIAVYFF